MQSEIFKFKTATNQESMNNAVRVLSALEGVSDVTPSLPRNELSVQFNANLASKQSLQAALVNAGFAVQGTSPTGGCGGGCTCG
jgi:hypothetical protein